jgi:5'-3' exonuclease|tara:strand:+ start:230 stop:394 length:165 start_codon:yes stop_codon:yes gene_type:complete
LVSTYTYGRPAVDNFYLDANGILHKCTHGDAGESVAASIDDSLVLICRCRGTSG